MVPDHSAQSRPLDARIQRRERVEQSVGYRADEGRRNQDSDADIGKQFEARRYSQANLL